MTSETLKRYAAVVPVLVDAGCEAPPNTYMDLHNVPEVSIAVLEQWFHQTVVPWARKTYCNVQIPDENEGLWIWGVEDNGRWVGENDSTSPTEANIQCAEALAKVIGGEG